MGIEARWKVNELPLKEPFAIATGTISSSPHVLLELERDGIIGRGEAAPVWFYGESINTVLAVLPVLTGLVDDPWDWDGIESRLQRAFAGAHPSARCAVTMAVLDLCAQEAGLPVSKLLGLGAVVPPKTSYTIGLGSLADTDRKTRAAVADGYQIIKVKLGGSDDRNALATVRRAAPDALIRVDANTGWDRPMALAMLGVLAGHGVEMLEQPLVADDLAGHRMVRERSPIPLIADESIGPMARLGDVAAAFDGINLKLAKNGGPLRMVRLSYAARELGLSVMFGCMVESSLGIAAGVHLAGLADRVDLDSPLLIADDPFEGLSYVDGRPTVPDAPGWGVTPRVPVTQPA